MDKIDLIIDALEKAKGKQYGISTPANQSVYALVKMLEKFNL